MAFTPAVFSIGPKIETHLFPVITEVKVINESQQPTGFEFSLEFRKERQCEFIALTWYADRARLAVRHEVGAGQPSEVWTRPIGEHRAGPWTILGLRSLHNTRAYALHRCHPLWITMTEFYRN